ncbi:guanylate-binding protein 7-like isoform X2 [Engystomops pustulosus]
MSALRPMTEPVCLIENIGGNKLVVNKEAEKILLEIMQPVVVIAIVGKYRTGKSYLMNKLAEKRTGFPLGSSIQSKTKGIWMWCVPHPSHPNQTLVLLDTEGLGDVEKGDCKNDAWIFSLAVLLSSAFVYNSVGTIDQQSMEQLHYVTELTKRIKVKSSPQRKDETGEYKKFFPSFTWCVRDFCLLLEKNGKSLTEDEYLMSSLELRKGSDKKIQDYNLPRECILRFFHTHKCFTFDRPTSTKKLQHLEELEEEDLEEDFVEQARRFYQYMIGNSHVKTLDGGLEVTGRMLAVLATSYVKAIQSGAVPCMENAVLALAEIENNGALQDALSRYECEMNKQVSRFPTETQKEFLNLHKDCEREAITVFLDRSFNDKDQRYQRKLKELVQNKMNQYSTRNEEASRAFCRKLLKQLSVKMEDGIHKGRYSIPGGHKLYLIEKLKVTGNYNLTPGKGTKALEVMQQYITEKKEIEAAILQADESLTEKERQLAEERAEAERAEREREITEKKNQELQQCIEDQKRSFEEHKVLLLKKMEEERKRMIAENEKVIKRKLQEQEAMMKAGYDDKILALQKEIGELRQKNQSSDSSCIIL